MNKHETIALEATDKKAITQETITVNCPTCQKQVVWSTESPYRPFCSQRCRLIDLGEWANEAHRIADKDATEQDLWSEDTV